MDGSRTYAIIDGVTRELNTRKEAIEKNRTRRSLQTPVTTVHYDNTNEQYSRLTFAFIADRASGSYVISIFLPLAIISCIGWLVLTMKEFDSQITASIALILTLVAFQFLVHNMLPRVNYVTYVDALFLVAYGMVLFTLSAVVACRRLSGKNREVEAARLTRVVQWMYPCVYGSAIFFLLFYFRIISL
jgi:hypothetical protein